MNFLVTHVSGRVSWTLPAQSLQPAPTILTSSAFHTFKHSIYKYKCLPMVHLCISWNSMARFPVSCSKTILAFCIFVSSITQSTVDVNFLVDFAAKFSLNSTLFITDLNSGNVSKVLHNQCIGCELQ